MIRIYIYSFTPHHKLHLHFSPYTYSLSSLLPHTLHLHSLTSALCLLCAYECPLDSFRPSSLPLFYPCPSLQPSHLQALLIHTHPVLGRWALQYHIQTSSSHLPHSSLPLTQFLTPTPHSPLLHSLLTLTLTLYLAGACCRATFRQLTAISPLPITLQYTVARSFSTQEEGFWVEGGG